MQKIRFKRNILKKYINILFLRAYDGAEEGEKVGPSDGRELGATEGTFEGATEGDFEGVTEGFIVGAFEDDGPKEGAVVVDPVGKPDG